MKTFIVFVVYGTLNGKMGQEIQVYRYKYQNEAREHAARIGGWVSQEKREYLY